MGTLSTIGVINGGSLSDVTKEKFKDSVAKSIQTGVSIGNTNVPGGVIPLGAFELGTVDEVAQQYPAWNAYFVEGLLTNIAKSLDTIPDTGIAFPILFDPTRPIAIIIAELSDLFGPINLLLNFPIIDIILGNIGIFLAKAKEISETLQEIIDAISEGIEAALEKAAVFFEIIKDAIKEALEAAGELIEAIESVMSALDAAKERIIQKIVEIAEKIKNAVLSLIPDFSLPSLDLSFLLPTIDISPLFATIEIDGFDGIVTKFLKMMAVFLKIPGEIIQAITDAIAGVIDVITSFIQKIIDAIKKIFIDVTQAIKEMLDAILGFIWEKISEIIDINPSAILEAVSTITIVTFFAKFFVVALIGFVLGSGLITQAAAKALDLI